MDGRPLQQRGDERIVAEPVRSNLGCATERLTFDDAVRGRRQLGAGRFDGYISGGDGVGEVAREAEPVFDQRLVCDGNVDAARDDCTSTVMSMTPLLVVARLRRL